MLCKIYVPSKSFNQTHTFIALTIGNILFLTALPPERTALQTMFTPVMRATFSIVGSRIMLNLRSVLKAAEVDLSSCNTGISIPTKPLRSVVQDGYR